MRRLVVGLCVVAFVLVGKAWGGFQLTPEATHHLESGIDHMANLDYTQAREAFARLKNHSGGDLLYPFLKGLVEIDETIQEDWGEEEKIKEVFDRFLAQVAPVVTRGEALLEATPNNPDLLLTMGIMRGAKAAVDHARRNYFAALGGIRASHRHLARTLEVDQDRVDALWALGLYDYSVSQVPPLLKPLVAIVLPSGGRERGLERLKRAAREGTFTRTPAAIALTRILTGMEEEFAEALPYAEFLAERYPGNREFLFLLAFLYSETDQTLQALSVAESIRGAVEQHRPRFPPEIIPRYLQLRGKIAMDAGAHEEALTFFRQAIEQGNSKYAWITAWAYTRTGMIYDLQGERQKAEKSYQKAVEIDGGGLARQMAQRYLSSPYRGKTRQPRG